MKKITYFCKKDGLMHVKRRRLSRASWNEKRFKVWVRDNYCCVRCKARLPFKKAHIDHIKPVCLGGGDGLSNLRTLCVYCHSLRADPSHDKLRRRSFDKGIIPKNFHELMWDG